MHPFLIFAKIAFVLIAVAISSVILAESAISSESATSEESAIPEASVSPKVPFQIVNLRQLIDQFPHSDNLIIAENHQFDFTSSFAVPIKLYYACIKNGTHERTFENIYMSPYRSIRGYELTYIEVFLVLTNSSFQYLKLLPGFYVPSALYSIHIMDFKPSEYIREVLVELFPHALILYHQLNSQLSENSHNYLISNIFVYCKIQLRWKYIPLPTWSGGWHEMNKTQALSFNNFRQLSTAVAIKGRNDLLFPDQNVTEGKICIDKILNPFKAHELGPHGFNFHRYIGLFLHYKAGILVSQNKDTFLDELYSRQLEYGLALVSPDTLVNKLFHPIKEENINFLTCDGTSDAVTFTIYARPYDTCSWGAMLAKGILLIFYATLAVHRQSRKTSVHLVCLDFLFVFYGSLVEMFRETQYNFGRNRKMLVISLWMLLSVILTNGYKGVVVSELTRGRPIWQKYEKFNQLEDFVVLTDQQLLLRHIYSIVYFDHPYDVHPIELEKLFFCFCGTYTRVDPRNEISFHLSEAGISKNAALKRIVDFTKSTTFQCLDTEGVFSLTGCLGNYIYINETERSVSRRFPGADDLAVRSKFPSAFIFAELGVLSETIILLPTPVQRRIYEVLSFCSKLALLAREKNLDIFLAFYLNYRVGLNSTEDKVVIFRKGTEPLGTYVLGYELTEQHQYDRLLQLMQSGIYRLWEKWFPITRPNEIDKFMNEHEKTQSLNRKPKKLNLTGNIVTCFYMILSCLGVCTLVLLYEVRLLICSSLIEVITRLKIAILRYLTLIKLKTLKLPSFSHKNAHVVTKTRQLKRELK